MKNDSPITEYSITRGTQRGTRLTLYPGRLVHEGGDAVEQMSLTHLAALRIEFLREPRKLKWAIIFLALMLFLHGISGPLQGLATNAATEVAEQAKRDGTSGGVPAALGVAFRAMAHAAAALPTIGFALAAWAAALLFLYWRGRTTLTLVLGASEREYSVPGHDRMLVGFADSLGERFSAGPG